MLAVEIYDILAKQIRASKCAKIDGEEGSRPGELHANMVFRFQPLPFYAFFRVQLYSSV